MAITPATILVVSSVSLWVEWLVASMRRKFEHQGSRGGGLSLDSKQTTDAMRLCGSHMGWEGGVRAVLRVGDPGVDAGWVRHRTLGVAFASVWIVATTIGLGVMAAGHVGLIGWIEGWQSRTFGFESPILAILPLMALPFAPAVSLLWPAEPTRPFRLGMQQAYSPEAGPRFNPTTEMRAGRVLILRRATTLVLVAGIAAFIGGVGWAWRASLAPLPAPTATAYADLERGGGPLPRGLVVITGAAETGPTWLQQTVVRGSTVRTAWRAVAPAGKAGPRTLVERIAVGVDDSGQLRGYARGTLSGHIRPLDDWTGDRLREVGFAVTDRTLVLDRSMSDEGDAVGAWMPGYLTAMFGFVAAFMGGLLRWRTGKLAR